MTQRSNESRKINLLQRQGADFIECKRPVFFIINY